MTVENPQDSSVVETDAGQQTGQIKIADESEQHTAGAVTDAVTQSTVDEPPRPAVNRIYVYGAIAAALGILAGIAFAVIAGLLNARSGSFDLGAVTSDADGLTGHLVLTWNEKPGYRLVVQPSDPQRNAEFSLAVSRPPRPLSVDIQLKDSAGSMLCGKTIVLKYDPGHAGAVGAAAVAQSEALELQREHGQDIFQNYAGPDGQIESISSQGEMPCSRQVYERAASWSLSPNFPTLDEQAELLGRQPAVRADANTSSLEGSDAKTPPGSHAASRGRRKAKKKDPEGPVRFAIEGDDELVGYDPSKGVIETSGRKTFIVTATGGDNAGTWQTVPANIHYKCDLNASCTLTRKGAVVLHAQLKQ